MLKKINSINQRILEKYPTIWNTKLVWMLLIGAIIHLFFFLLGYVWFSNPKSLQTTSANLSYFSSGLIYIQCIISLILLVGWVVQVFKNNAFKNFYPSTPWKMFVQLLHYIVIIFVSISFYISFVLGAHMYVSNKYNDKEIQANTAVINQAMAFIPYDIEYYTVDNRINPKIFETLYCETNPERIYRGQPFLKFKDREYQYFTLKKVTSNKKNDGGYFYNPDEGETSVKTEEKEKYAVFYYRDKVVDMTKYFPTTAPSFYNYSNIFSNNNPYYGMKSYENTSYIDISEEQLKITSLNADLLNSKDRAKFEKLFNEFFKISKKYDIETDLNTEKLMGLVYNPDSFEVKHYVRLSDPKKPNYGYDYTSTMIETGPSTEVEKEYHDKLTTHYYEQDRLRNLLNNVKDIKDAEMLNYTFISLLATAFGISLLLFCFRLTGLKPMIFAYIASGVSILVLVIVNLVLGAISEDLKIGIFITTLGLWGIYLLAGFVGFHNFSKNIIAIIINLVITLLPIMILMFIALIAEIQDQNCYGKTGYDLYNTKSCQNILTLLDYYVVYVIMAVSLPLIYLYLHFVHRWKARPE